MSDFPAEQSWFLSQFILSYKAVCHPLSQFQVPSMCKSPNVIFLTQISLVNCKIMCSGFKVCSQIIWQSSTQVVELNSPPLDLVTHFQQMEYGSSDDVGLLRLCTRHCSFFLAFSSVTHSVRSQLPCHKDAQVDLGRGL